MLSALACRRLNDAIQEALGEDDEDYILFDCPGQIELYTHMNVMRRFVDQLQQWNFRLALINYLKVDTKIRWSTLLPI